MEKKLKILFLCSWYPNPDEKSNGIFIKRHALALSLQHHVTVVFVKAVSVKDALTIVNEEENFTEHLYFYPKIKSKVPGLSSAIKLLKFREHYKKVLDQLIETQFDVIHVNTVFPAAIPALYAQKKYPAAKLFITEHWSGYYSEDGNYKGRVLRYYTKQLVEKAKAIFVISKKLQQAMLARGLKSNYELINNVVDTTVFIPFQNSEKTDATLKILHVSSLVEREKNISGILAVAYELSKKNKAFHLTIVGENNNEMHTHRSLVQKYNLTEKITFTGFQTSSEIANYMNKADVFLLLSHYEGMPVVVLESLACGLPVITTNVGEIPAMVKLGMGIVLNNTFEMDSVESLLKYKREDFLDKTHLHKYITEFYSPEAVCKQISKLYTTYSC